MSEDEAATHRQQDLYFNEVFQLKVGCEYHRLYRHSLGRWVRGFNVLRAVASNGAIVTWAVVQSHSMVWGGIIAGSQLADALKDAIPITARYTAVSGLVMSLDALFIEALFEWEGVFAGQFSNEEITERRRKLMQLRHDAEIKHFPFGDLPVRKDFLALAETDASVYLETMFRLRAAR